MFVLEFTFYATSVLYAIFYEHTLLYLYAAILAVYVAFSQFYYPGKMGSVRSRLAQSLWSTPSEGIIHSRVEVDCTKVMEYLQTPKAKAAHVTFTHVVIKAVGECLNGGRESMNGKIVFGKFVQFPTVDVSCLVNVGNGEDLASVLVTDVDKKSFEDIANFINNRGKIAKMGQDQEHKQRTGPMKLLPPFIIKLLIQVAPFLTYNLGITLKPLGLKKDCFGAATVTSLGAFGFKDVFVPFTPMMRSSMIVAANKIQNKPIVKDGQVVIAPVVCLNFTIDHRFVDGGKALRANAQMEDVFTNPEKYGEK